MTGPTSDRSGTLAPPDEPVDIARPLDDSAVRPGSRWGRLAEPRWQVGLIVFCVTLAAVLLRFTVDDAFITFRYSKNLVEGRGLVFNPGERVEGYTNFLWTLLMAVPLKFGWGIEAFSRLATLLSAMACIVLTFRLGRQVGGSERSGVLAALFLGVNATFILFATSGMETLTQTALLLGCTVIALDHERELPRVGALFGWSALATLAVLVRLDSAVAVVAVGLVWIHSLHRSGNSLRAIARRFSVVLLLPMATVLPWMVWKVSFYGHIFPNTFYAKSSSSSFNPMGLIYLGVFVLSFLYVIPVIALIAKMRSLLASFGGRMVIAIVILWCVYIAVVGGDWMDFRFMIPVMPALFAAFAAVAVDSSPAWRKAIVASCVIGGLGHVGFPGMANVDGLPTVRLLSVKPPPNWVSEGEYLHRYFPGGLDRQNQVTIAVVAAGAIPYLSELPAIDMVGLTDATVARSGHVIPYPSGFGKPGHLRMARISYLRNRGVNLVLGIPVTMDAKDLPDKFSVSRDRKDVFSVLFHDYPITLGELGGASMVAIPVDNGNVMLAIYLERHPEVDRHIAENGWKVIPIVK